MIYHIDLTNYQQFLQGRISLKITFFVINKFKLYQNYQTYHYFFTSIIQINILYQYLIKKKMLLQEQVHKRAEFLNQYLGQISKKLQFKQYDQALFIIAKQKKNITHTNVSKYNPNAFLVDSLKAKNQKLKQIIQETNAQKIELEKLAAKQKGGISNSVYSQSLKVSISRFQLLIKDKKKVEYEPASLRSDYNQITICQENKLYTQKIVNIEFIQKKGLYLNVHMMQDNNSKLYIIFKFQQESQLQKWINCFQFGKTLGQSKKKRYLFLPIQNKQQILPFVNSQKQTPKQSISPSQIASSKHHNNLHLNSMTPIFFNSLPQNPFQRRSNTTNLSITQPPQYPRINHLNYIQRPPPLNRIRGKTQFSNSFEIQGEHDAFEQSKNRGLQVPEKINFRKASQDITLRGYKSTYNHGKKLQKFRSQKNLLDQVLSQANSNKNKQNMSKKIEKQIEKKNELLQRNRHNSYKSNIFDRDRLQKLKIQQIDDDTKSKSTQKNFKKKSIKDHFQENQAYVLDDGQYAQSEKVIEQLSQMKEQSPMFPKKIKYEDGSKIRLYPVQSSGKQRQNSNQDTLKPPLPHKDQIFKSQSGQSLPYIQNDSSQNINEHEGHQSHPSEEQSESYQQMIDDLKKGIILTKCAQGGFWTRQKQVKLSQNDITLLIVDVKDKKIRKANIVDIQSIQYQKYGKGIIKHIQQIQQAKCMLINVKQGKDIKRLQFVANNAQNLKKFAQNLRYYVETLKN